MKFDKVGLDVFASSSWTWCGEAAQSSSVFVFPTVPNFMSSDCLESFADSMEPNLASHRCREV